ncbi:MAG: S8 family peptidase [Candidatus Marinimicrobia bacterium]|nr:S8 family peptidase [Candidatus Neomarinimicrobiota bacterium]MCF7839851.1 S8 family peptidase [Candidatus Neomarinimicrobiota bacterium]MCF7902561.1 S8 family peptidase [Candidatus Neomarinimicrobiota bacterium]
MSLVPYKRFLLVVLAVLLGSPQAVRATQNYWVFFHDKGPEALQKPIPLSSETSRRIALRGTDNVWQNIPVYEPYVDEISQMGVAIRQRSRWFNAVSVSLSAPTDLALIRQLSSVKGLRPVARAPRDYPPKVLAPLARTTEFSYGNSRFQNELLQLPALHTEGWNGTGVRIGVFDTGFTLTHPVFQQLSVLAGYDFVANESNLNGAGSNHGTACLGLIAGYLPGEFMGAAFGAQFLLARTENATTETPAEEDNWVAALEWADVRGVDIISSSLAYKEFDDPADSYPTDALDGETTIITQATNMATQRGILVVNAMGNEGPGPSTLWAPADGKHVLSVGGINQDESAYELGSRGPTADGRIKPDVVTLATTVFLPSQTSGYYYSSGTSFAAPMIAGGAALVLQAKPDLPPDSVIALFHAAGDRLNSPDNTFGWGVPNVRAIIAKLTAQTAAETSTRVFPNPVRTTPLYVKLSRNRAPILESYRLYNVQGRLVDEGNPEVTNINEFRISHLPDLAAGLYFIIAETATETFQAKFVYLP